MSDADERGRLHCPGIDGSVDPELRIEGGVFGRGEPFVLRVWREDDRDAVVRHLNHRSVWRNLTNLIPHPYTLEAADEWIALNRSDDPPGLNLAIDVEGEVVGTIGGQRKGDLHTRSSSVGYWLGPELHGRGLATAALGLFTPWLFAHSDLVRLEAEVIGWNPASARVLEKCGYRLEGRLRSKIWKDGEIADALVYAIVRGDPGEPG